MPKKPNTAGLVFSREEIFLLYDITNVQEENQSLSETEQRLRRKLYKRFEEVRRVFLLNSH